MDLRLSHRRGKGEDATGTSPIALRPAVRFGRSPPGDGRAILGEWGQPVP